MQRTWNLGTEAWAAAGTLNVPLKPIPDSYADDTYAVACLTLELQLDVTTGAGGGCTARELMEWVSNIFLKAGDHVVVNGVNAFQMIEGFGRLDHGEPLDANIAAIAASQANVQINIPVRIEFENFDDNMDSNDGLVPAAFFNDAQLQVTLGAAALNANTTINSAALQVSASGHRVPDLNIVKLPTYQAITGDLFEQLPRGIYTALAIVAPSGAFAAANITTVNLRADGELIHSNVLPDAVIREFERCKVDRTDPAGCTSWSDDASNAVILPLIWPSRHSAANKARYAVDTGSQTLNTDLQGSLTSPVYIMRYYSKKVGADAERYLAAVGVQDPSDVEVKFKTASKRPLSEQEVTEAPGLNLIPAKVVGTQSGLRSSLGVFSRRIKRFFPTRRSSIAGRPGGMRRF
jgi:hypothetical protein